MNRLLTILWLLLSSPFALANPFPVTVDSCGKPITFNQPPQRAVINDLNMAEMAFALDLQDRIVGLTGITGWYKLTPQFKAAMGPSPSWRLNTRRWKRCWRSGRTFSSPAGTTA